MQWSNFQIITEEATLEEVVSHCYLVKSTDREWLTDNFLPPSKVPSWFSGAEMTGSLKKPHNYPVKRLLSPSRMNTIFTNLERWNQMLVLPVGVNCTKIHPLLMDQWESRSDHRERMWSTLRQLLSVLEQRTKRGEEKEQMISFHHSVSLHRAGAFSFTRPPQVWETKAAFQRVFRFSRWEL